MDPEQRQILKEKRDAISSNVSLEAIRPLLKQYKIFNKYMWQDITSISDVLDLLPTRGPEAFQHFILILREAKYCKEADSLGKSYISIKIPSDLIYKMTSKPLGYCLLINNVKFDEPIEERFGSDVDAKSLKRFFEKINFKVDVKHNLKAFEMRKCIKDFSRSNFKSVDSSIVVILSHGNQEKNKDVILGTDCESMYKEEIIDAFNNEDCSDMQGKPKVFFFIACRGGKKDYGVLKVPKRISTESADSVGITSIMPRISDILVVHSSLPYHISMRDHAEGSWFCQDLVSALENHYLTCDLEDIIKIVNRKLMKRVSREYCVTQAAHSENYGFKKLLLCGNPSN